MPLSIRFSHVFSFEKRSYNLHLLFPPQKRSQIGNPVPWTLQVCTQSVQPFLFGLAAGRSGTMVFSGCAR